MTHCRTGLYYQYRTSLNLYSSVCIIHTSLSKISFMNIMEGAAMGSLVSPTVANLCMEYFERSPLACLHPPRYLFMFMDDIFIIQQQSYKQLFLDHINNIHLAIRFTVEGNQENGSIPFLDTLPKPEADNFSSITVYHKPTHTDQCLQWDSHHNLPAKYSVAGTLIQGPKQFALLQNSSKGRYST